VTADTGVQSVSYVVNDADAQDGRVAIGGTGEVGAQVEVTTATGAVQTTTVGANGRWSMEFTTAQVGGTGDRTESISIKSTDSYGNSTTISETIDIDTIAEVDFDAGVSGGRDHVANLSEAGPLTSGVVLSGTSEIGTTSVMVTMNGNTFPASVDPLTGDWDVTFPPGTYAQGTNTYQASAVATDAHGNTDTATMNVRVDTEVTDLSTSSTLATGADGYVGLDDAAGGIRLQGDMETNWTDVPGESEVVVNFNGANYTATVNQATGEWYVDIPEAAVPQGYQGNFGYTVTGTDSVSNTLTIPGTVAIDTRAPVATDIVGDSSNSAGGQQVYSAFTVETPTETMSVARVEANGAVTDLNAGSDYATGAVPFQPTQTQITLNPAAPMSNGQDLIITETDAAGNSASTLAILEGGPAVETVGNANLGAYNIDAIDLGRTDTELRLTEADILALSGNTDTVMIRGEAAGPTEANSGDTVTIDSGGQAVTNLGAQVGPDGLTYNGYQLGSATILIEDDITSVNIV